MQPAGNKGNYFAGNTNVVIIIVITKFFLLL